VFAGSELFKVTEFKEATNALLVKGIIKKGGGGKGKEFRGGVKKESGGNPTSSRAESQALALACFNDIQARLKAVPDLDEKVTLFFQEFPIDFGQSVDVTTEDLVRRSFVVDVYPPPARSAPCPLIKRRATDAFGLFIGLGLRIGVFFIS